MARVLIEYFKPDPVEPGAFPLGVVAQDDEALVYRLFSPVKFNLHKFPEFHLPERETIMERTILVPSFRRRTEQGLLDLIPVTDVEFLQALASSGTGYFRYGTLWLVEGFDALDAARGLATMPEEHFEGIARQDAQSTLRQLERMVG